MFSYFTHKPRKQGVEQEIEEPTSPVLNDDDEKFLQHITSDEELPPPPLPARPTVILDNGKQIEGEDEADQVPLPTSPPAEDTVDKGKAPAKEKDGQEKEKNRINYWSYVPQMPSVQVPNLGFTRDRSKERAGADLASAAEAVKEGKDLTQQPKDAEKEKRDLTSILDGLNLGAVNNRLFAASKESQKLMEDFNQVLKDLVNGVPTAYDDLEKLLTKNHQQLQNMYGNMPPFVKTLVKSLPAKMSTTLAPELMAAMSEKPGADAKKMEEMAGTASAAAKQGKKVKRRIPTLKEVVKKQGTVAGMLKSIVNFLKLRFPAIMTGTNILMSLAVFVLLFVFWYCHKRGRETRLEKEKLAADEDDDGDETVSELDESTILEKTGEEKPSASASDARDILTQPEP